MHSLVENHEMNLLSLVGPRLDNIYQIRRKCYYSSGWNFFQSKQGLIYSDEFNNFYVHDFYCWNHLRFQNLVWSCHLVKFKIWTVQILSNENMIIIKVVHIDEFYNFGIHEFFMWNHLLFQNIVSSWNYLNFKIWIVQTKSHDKMIKIKVVHVDELYNFYVYNIFILGHLMS